MSNGYTKTIPEIVSDLKTELKDFIATRVAMLRSEMGEKWSRVKVALPSLMLGLAVLWTAWLLFTGVLVTLIGNAFDSPLRYVYSLLIVFGAYLLPGGMLASSALRRLRQTSLKPERTLRTLKQDEVWLQTEAKTQV